MAKIAEKALAALKQQYRDAKEAYYNGEPLMTDARFDRLEDQIRKADPDWKELKKTGVRTKFRKEEVKLKQFMPSLHKLYPEHELKIAQHAKSIVLDKLDGTSLQLQYKYQKPVFLATRGDGELGKDISFFIPKLVQLGLIPSSIKVRNNVVLRLEGVMNEKIFQKKWSSKVLGEKEGYDNARQLVNGLFNRQDMHPALKDVSLVVLGVYSDTIERGLRWAEAEGFMTCYFEKPRSENPWTSKKLSAHLKKRIAESPFKIDGLVLATRTWYLEYEDAEKPSYRHIVAFKENAEDTAPKVEVKDIIWQKTRLNRWVPKIEIEPTEMDGVTVTYATAHNAKWMINRGIGPGAVVKVLRSGGVIPKIVGVVKKARKLKMPPDATFEFKGVHIVAKEDGVSRVEQNLWFLTTMGVEFIALQTVKALYDLGWKFPLSYVHAAQMSLVHPDLMEVMGKANARKAHQQLVGAFGADATIQLKKLMVASGCFPGIGQKRFSLIEEAGISMGTLVHKATDIEEMLAPIPGFAAKTIKQIEEGVAAFRAWFKPYRDLIGDRVNTKLPKPKKKAQGKLSGLKISFTGFRDKSCEQHIERLGGEVINFGSKTDVLLYSETGKKSSKVEKAGSKAMTWNQFCKKYDV